MRLGGIVGTTRRLGGFKGFKHVWKGKFSYLNDDFDAKLMDLQKKHYVQYAGLPTTHVFAEFLHTLKTSRTPHCRGICRGLIF